MIFTMASGAGGDVVVTSSYLSFRFTHPYCSAGGSVGLATMSDFQTRF